MTSPYYGKESPSASHLAYLALYLLWLMYYSKHHEGSEKAKDLLTETSSESTLEQAYWSSEVREIYPLSFS